MQCKIAKFKTVHNSKYESQIVILLSPHCSKNLQAKLEPKPLFLLTNIQAIVKRQKF